MLQSRFFRLYILSFLLAPPGVLFAQQQELTTAQVQQLFEQQ